VYFCSIFLIMNLLSIENLSKCYGDKLLFDQISFGIEKGQKTALIAKNGSGKTTLLNIIMGLDIPDEGTVTFRNGIHVAYLPQSTQQYNEISILDIILNTDTPLIRTIKTYEKAINQYTVNQCLENRKNMEYAIEQMDTLCAWNYENRIKDILSRFQIQDIFSDFNTLSGGEQKKVILAQTLLSESEMLILDEPTNHLDIDMIEWLEDFFSNTNTTLLMVTHDRFFLDKICTDILELNEAELYRYKGKYSYYLEKKAERIANQMAEIEHAKSIYRKELEWIRSTPQARTTKAKARIDSFEEVKQKAHQNITLSDKNFAVKTERIGNKILEINNLDFKYDDRILIKDFSYVFKKGERCGVVGPNGCGKSTLLKLIVNQLRPTAGRILTGETIVFGYYDQQGLSSAYFGKRLIDIIEEQAEVIQTVNGNYISASRFLSHFGFSFHTQYTYYENLSGGQRRKFYLLLVLLKNPNFLILDEPTNDFDIETLNILEDFLLNFKGCLLVVSHDRWFMDKLVDHLFVFEDNGKIKDFYGNYTEYKEHKKIIEKGKRMIEKSSKAKTPKTVSDTSCIKLTYKERKELETLELSIQALEHQKEELMGKLSSPSDFAADIENISKQYAIVCEELNHQTLRWFELSEKE